MIKSRGKLILIILVVIVLAGAVYYMTAGSEPDAQNAVSRNRTVKVKKGSLYKTIPAEGYIKPIEEKNLSFPSKTGGSTKIEKIYVEEGDRVEKGQLLVQLDKTEARLNHVQKKNAYNRAKINASKNEIEEAKINLQLAKNSLENTELTAPFTGIITDINVEEGGYYTSGNVVTIKDVSRLKVEVNIAESDIPDIKLGQKAEVTLKSLPGEVINGEVTDIEDEADNSGGTVTLPVTVTLNKVEKDIKINSSAELDIIVGQAEDIISAPITAIVSKDGKDYVYRVVNGKQQAVAVETGLTDGLKVEIKSGLNEGDEIIVNTFQQAGTEQSNQGRSMGPGMMGGPR